MKKEELQFLPAAIEIQDTPPAPAGRAILWSISLFFVLAVTWSIIGELDIVSVAQGKVIPVGHSKTVQPLEAGRIREIHVVEGQQVHKGEVLISLDDETLRADLRRIAFERVNTYYELIRFQELIVWLENQSENVNQFSTAKNSHKKSDQNKLAEAVSTFAKQSFISRPF